MVCLSNHIVKMNIVNIQNVSWSRYFSLVLLCCIKNNYDLDVLVR